MTAAELSRLLEAALDLPTLQGGEDRLRHLAADAARLEALAGRPLRVALLGSTGAGKSTLLNALAGATLAEEGTERPTSREAVVYAPDDADLGQLGRVVGRVLRYRARAGAPWSGQVFVDTPDLNSVAAAHAEAALAVLAESDVALVVLHRGSVAEARPQEMLRRFARRRALLFVLNHADQLGPEARTTLAAQAARVATEELGVDAPPPVFVVSALAARSGRGAADDWQALLAALRSLAEEGVAAEVRGRNRRAVLAELGRHVEEGLAACRELEAAVQGLLDRGLARARPALEADFAARLAAAGPELRAAVRRAAAERLSGPAAWGLRLSGWSGAGLLGGGLLARAHLPAGLLVAASGAVLDQVQTRTRAHATRGRMAHEEPALEAQAREALAEARTAAQQRGVQPAELGLPEAAEWARRLVEVRAAAWSEVAGFGVERAVAGWWRWARLLLLPLVQLPLLALLADVAWRTVRAYLVGPLLDARYYVNAAALGLVWAAGGALLAGLSLAGLARRVERGGARSFGEGLAAAEASLRAAVASALAVPRAAAEALAARGRLPGGEASQPSGR